MYTFTKDGHRANEQGIIKKRGKSNHLFWCRNRVKLLIFAHNLWGNITPFTLITLSNPWCHLQGVSKRLLKVRVSITSIFYGAEDLKFAQINFRTIQFDTSDETNLKDILASKKILFIFLIDFKKKQNLVANFEKKTDFLCEKHQITKSLTGRSFNYPWAAILWSLSS